MNIEEELKDIVEPCSCQDCGKLSGYIYRIKGSEIFLKKKFKAVKLWIKCPWMGGNRISFEDAFDSLDPQIQMKLIYHLDFFR